MADYNVFPQFSNVKSIVHDDWEFEDPVVETNMANGWTDARPSRSRGRFSLLRDIYTLDDADSNALLAFLIGQRLRAIPFQYFHPLMGTDIVRMKQSILPGKFAVQGETNWYTITLEVEQQF